jgi:hypothetical protein
MRRNISRLSYERLKKREAELKTEIARMLAAAEAADAGEDETFGKDKRGGELPDWVGDEHELFLTIEGSGGYEKPLLLSPMWYLTDPILC